MREMRLVRLASCVPFGAELPSLRQEDSWPRPIDWLMRDDLSGETLRLCEERDGTFTLKRHGYFSKVTHVRNTETGEVHEVRSVPDA